MADGPASEPTDFFAGLLQDHARIEARLAAFEQAVDTLSKAENDAAALAVVVETLAFFATEGALHEEVEERTLFPRLQGLSEFRQIVSALEFQHRMNRTEGEQLAACVGQFGPGRGRELRRVAFRFVEMHRGHAFAEERALFPLAAARLSQQEVAEMGRETSARRTAPRPSETR